MLTVGASHAVAKPHHEMTKPGHEVTRPGIRVQCGAGATGITPVAAGAAAVSAEPALTVPAVPVPAVPVVPAVTVTVIAVSSDSASSGSSSSTSCVSSNSDSSDSMLQARWALALILLLVALPAGGVRAAPWRPWAVALEREPVDKEAPQEDHQAVPVPGENTGAVQPTGVPGASQLREPALSAPTAGQKPAEYLQERLNKDQQHNRLRCTGSKPRMGPTPSTPQSPPLAPPGTQTQAHCGVIKPSPNLASPGTSPPDPAWSENMSSTPSPTMGSHPRYHGGPHSLQGHQPHPCPKHL
ncbi:probable ubiquitin receptor RAD23 isoform X3 [Pipra filicauda]|uniref:Probable ubiquitin receptor RAD23 isoform X3 n=1 Tax=Pipra filicauda TaxID=649802 RepID=A0A7R5KWW9_9PASS|nr:probable ubiquitin receptor RAD23 isoform X3 [Pipra filicauda]